MKTKSIIIIIIAIIATLGIYQRVFNGKEIDKRNAERLQEVLKPIINQDSVLHVAILEKIRKEPKVDKAFITEANVLYVTVKDDGTNRNGYAAYFCQVLKENNIINIRVKVVKTGSSKDAKSDNAYGILLGESDCRL